MGFKLTRVRAQSGGVSDLNKGSPRGCPLFVSNPWVQPLSLTHLLEASFSRRGCGRSRRRPEDTSYRFPSCGGSGEVALSEVGSPRAHSQARSLGPAPAPAPAPPIPGPTPASPGLGLQLWAGKSPPGVRSSLALSWWQCGWGAGWGGVPGEGALLSASPSQPLQAGRMVKMESGAEVSCPCNPTSEATTGQRSSGRRWLGLMLASWLCSRLGDYWL